MRNREVTLNNKHNIWQRIGRGCARLTTIAAIFMVTAAPVLAATNYAQSGAQWVLSMMKWIVIAITATVAGLCVAKKEIAKLIIVLVLGCLMIFFCASPTSLIKLGSNIGSAFNLR